MNALPTRLQRALEEVYRIDGTVPVEPFCIDRPTLALVGAEGTERESLMVRHAGDETHLALFIADEILAEVENRLDAFCAATEGVSHFVYFTFCGDRQDRPVSQIELEVQAEIDKFVLLRFVCGVADPELVPDLFDRFQLRADLSEPEQARYTVANQVGRRYARRLDQLLRRGHGDRALEDARSLYRKPLAAKLEHVARAA